MGESEAVDDKFIVKSGECGPGLAGEDEDDQLRGLVSKLEGSDELAGKMEGIEQLMGMEHLEGKLEGCQAKLEATDPGKQQTVASTPPSGVFAAPNNLFAAWIMFREFEDFTYQPHSGHTVQDFVDEWESRAEKAKSVGVEYPDILLAFKLLEKCHLLPEQVHLAIAALTDAQQANAEQQAQAVSSLLLAKTISYIKTLEGLKSEHFSDDRAYDVNESVATVKVEIVDDETGNGFDSDSLYQEYYEDVPDATYVPKRSHKKKTREMKAEDMDDESTPSKKKRYRPERHNPYKSHICPQCGKGFTRSDHLKRHTRLHSRVLEFTCNTCQATFTERDEYRAHLKTHGADRPKKHAVKPCICHLCGKSFTRPEYLKTHIRSHNGEKPYQCDVCEKAYPHQRTLQIHMLSHSNSRPCVCDQCGKGFITATCLKRHKRTHTGEKAFVCEICNQAFAEKSKLKRHGRIHSGEKPYNCAVCNKAFTHSQNLRAHEKIHINKQQRQEQHRQQLVQQQLQQHQQLPSTSPALVTKLEHEHGHYH